MAQNKKRGKPLNENIHFEANSQYFTICCYVIGVILISILACRIFLRWEETQKFLKSCITVISPYFFGFLLAYLVNPLVNLFYEKVYRRFANKKNKKLHWVLSVVSSYVIVLGFLVICISYIVPQLITSVTDLIAKFPDFYNQIITWINNYVERNPNINENTINSITNDYLPHFQSILLDKLEKLVPMLYGAGMTIIRFLLNIIIALIVSIYLICDKKRIKNYGKKICYALFQTDTATEAFTIFKDCHIICKNFFIGKTIDSLIIGCLCFVIMSVLQLPYAMLISVIVGITNMIPYFGPYIGAVPGVLILFIDKPSHGLVFLIEIIILQAFDGWFLGPKILGNSTGLRPILILFAISCGGAIAGPIGMFLGVPILGILVYLLERFINHLLEKRHLEYTDGTVVTTESPEPDNNAPLC